MTVGVTPLLLAASIVIAVSVGSVGVAPSATLRIIWFHLVPGVRLPTDLTGADQIIWTFRLPRVLLAAVVGAGLSVVGATLQAVVRNPLADPFVLGVSSGAGFAAVIVLVAGAAGTTSLSAAAFTGSLAALAAVWLLARQDGQFSPTRLVLAGVALSYLFFAGTSFLIFQSGSARAAQTALFWLLGSLGGATWSQLGLPTLAIVAGTGWLTLRARPLNALLVGDDTAAALGVDVPRLRAELLIITSLLTGVAVAVSGGIGFVGLVVPHIARLLVGADHRRLLPLAAAGGALFLVWSDLLTRIVVAPEELPLSVITAAVGAPLFLHLLRRRPAVAGGR
ncbi:iron ABC transporter permease [Frankia sp. CiP3]|uniref:FecCD family ABC transporter permease n=1 Tax=Frankia sp. CiP3 TaxID=2880971 RepID=UPI001EF6321F|nr:iron ABC transporter permease [Frankia sp. CiP3]